MKKILYVTPEVELHELITTNAVLALSEQKNGSFLVGNVDCGDNDDVWTNGN